MVQVGLAVLEVVKHISQSLGWINFWYSFGGILETRIGRDRSRREPTRTMALHGSAVLVMKTLCWTHAQIRSQGAIVAVGRPRSYSVLGPLFWTRWR